MKAVIATDSFKGCLTSREVEAAVASALTDAELSCVVLSDGGDGMLEAFSEALRAMIVEVPVHDPLLRPVTARIGICADTAIIESAQACGLTLMSESERDPLAASSYGVGELIACALRRGCRKLLIGLGGSGTSDAGRGMLRGLLECFGSEKSLWEALKGCQFIIASDVENPLYGPNGAARVYGPQKGATPQMVEELDRRAEDFAKEAARHCGYDMSRRRGAGAAGGLGYALMQFLHARMCSGADLLLDMVGFDDMVRTADLVITGEGHSDRSTLMGKLPYKVLRHCRKVSRARVLLLCGSCGDRNMLLEAGFDQVLEITPEGMPLAEALRSETAKANIIRAIKARLPLVF